MEKEPKIEVSKNQRFRQLVENLLKSSNLFQITPLRATLGGEHTKDEKGSMEAEQVKIINAIENNELSSFLPERADDKTLDAVNCLTSIYDELGKEKPDEKFIEVTVEQLKQYL